MYAKRSYPDSNICGAVSGFANGQTNCQIRSSTNHLTVGIEQGSSGIGRRIAAGGRLTIPLDDTYRRSAGVSVSDGNRPREQAGV